MHPSLRARWRRPALAALAAAIALGCERGSAAPAVDSTRATPTPTHPSGYVVDSVRPPEEELRRFRATLPDTPTVLAGGASSRDALVRRFARSLERADTAALARMAITRAEYAYLVYPSSPFMRPPYQQPIWLAWMLLDRNTQPGLRRLVDRLGGHTLAYRGYTCDAEPTVEGKNRLWRNCRVRWVRAPGDTAVGRLFGVIVEREGRFKFASYENDF